MALAALSVPQFLGPLHALWAWVTQPQAACAPRSTVAMTPRPVARPVRPAWSTQASRRPMQVPVRSAAPVVRVVRVVDPGQARGKAGRMVISGRMADVCAELDRLAAREAQQR